MYSKILSVTEQEAANEKEFRCHGSGHAKQYWDEFFELKGFSHELKI